MSGNAYCACCTGIDLSHSRSAPPPIAVLPDAAFDAQVALAATRSAFVKEKYMASAETGESVFKIVPFGPAMIRCFKERGLVNAEGVPGFELNFDLETYAWIYISARVEDRLHILSKGNWILASSFRFPSNTHRLTSLATVSKAVAKNETMTLSIVPLDSLANYMRFYQPLWYSSWRLIKPQPWVPESPANGQQCATARFNLPSPFPGTPHPEAVWRAYYLERIALECIQADDPAEKRLFYPVKGDEYRHRVRTLPLSLLKDAGMADETARMWADGVLLAYWQGSGSAGFEFHKGYHSVVGRIYSPYTLQRVEIAMYYYHRSYSYGYETRWSLGYRIVEPTAKEHGTQFTTELFKWKPACMFDARGEADDWELIAHGLEEPDYSGGDNETVSNIFGLRPHDVDIITGVLGGPGNEFVKAIGAEGDKAKARRTTLQRMLASVAVNWGVQAEEEEEDVSYEEYGELMFTFGDRPDGNFDEGDWLDQKLEQLISRP